MWSPVLWVLSVMTVGVIAMPPGLGGYHDSGGMMMMTFGPPSSVVQSSSSGTTTTSSSPSSSGDDSGPRIYKHISIHVPPSNSEFDDEGPSNMKRVIRPMPQKADKVVNIIFIKAPSPSSSRMTEVILPPQPEMKTIVYVLVKKQDKGSMSDIKIMRPPTTQPPKPAVFFIKYSSKGKGGSSKDGESENIMHS